MKKVIIMFIFVFIGTLVFSQNGEWQKNQIKFSPFRMINMFNPGLEIGYQKNYGQFASQISIAYLTNINIFGAGNNRKNINGYRVIFEEKILLSKTVRRNNRLFISSEIGYNNVSLTIENRRFVPFNTEEFYIGGCNLKRQSGYFGTKMNMEFRINHLILEWYAGFGIIYQYVQHFNKRNATDRMDFNFEDLISPLFEEEGRYLIPYFPITVKIGYAF